MRSKRAVERELAKLSKFEHPRIDLEQYSTPADIVAHVIHLAVIEGDIDHKTVVDLGTGTGMFALGCTFTNVKCVVGVDIDSDALSIAQENEQILDQPKKVNWICADVTCLPVCPTKAVTVFMNPPFGAQKDHVHADRAFLTTAVAIADVTYSIHNRGSHEFITAFAKDNDGKVTHKIHISFDLRHQFDFHTHDRMVVPAELYRIAWGNKNSKS